MCLHPYEAVQRNKQIRNNVKWKYAEGKLIFNQQLKWNLFAGF